MGRPGSTNDEPKYKTGIRLTDLGARDSYTACDTVYETGCDVASCQEGRVLRAVRDRAKGWKWGPSPVVSVFLEVCGWYL
jgi:hypothetical protein